MNQVPLIYVSSNTIKSVTVNNNPFLKTLQFHLLEELDLGSTDNGAGRMVFMSKVLDIRQFRCSIC
jgi:hypothetical protein